MSVFVPDHKRTRQRATGSTDCGPCAVSAPAVQPHPSFALPGNLHVERPAIGVGDFARLCLEDARERQLAPGVVSAERCGASSTSGPARMFATTSDAGSTVMRSAASAAMALTRSATPLLRAFSDVARNAWGSMSSASTRRAPSAAAVTARMPEPQP